MTTKFIFVHSQIDFYLELYQTFSENISKQNTRINTDGPSEKIPDKSQI